MNFNNLPFPMLYSTRSPSPKAGSDGWVGFGFLPSTCSRVSQTKRTKTEVHLFSIYITILWYLLNSAFKTNAWWKTQTGKDLSHLLLEMMQMKAQSEHTPPPWKPCFKWLKNIALDFLPFLGTPYIKHADLHYVIILQILYLRSVRFCGMHVILR